MSASLPVVVQHGSACPESACPEPVEDVPRTDLAASRPRLRSASRPRPQRQLYDIRPLPSRPSPPTLSPTPQLRRLLRSPGVRPGPRGAMAQNGAVEMKRLSVQPPEGADPAPEGENVTKCYKMLQRKILPLPRRPAPSKRGRPAPSRSIPAHSPPISGRYRAAGRSRERQRGPLPRLTPERGGRARAVPVPARPRAGRSSGTR